jgi:uncharacterized membrane protein
MELLATVGLVVFWYVVTLVFNWTFFLLTQVRIGGRNRRPHAHA